MAKSRQEPFHEVLDAWVLRAIGHLDKDSEARLAEMEPELQRSFGIQGAWHEVVAQKLGFDENMASKILGIWAMGADKYEKASGSEPDPVEFAQTFVDVKILGVPIQP